MARQLLIGKAGVAVAYTAGKLANGAIDVQKESANGAHTSVAASGETSKTVPKLRIVQGTSLGNVYSPWIDARNVINWSGAAGAAQAAHQLVYTISTSSAVSFNLELKLINMTNGAEPFEMKNYEFAVVGIKSPTQQIVGLYNAIVADPPHWIKTVSKSAGALTLVGYKKGEAKVDGSVQGDLVQFKFADNSGDWSASTVAGVFSGGTRGVGDPFYVEAFEKSLQGMNFGYYNRIDRPNAPVTYADVDGSPADYDMYSVVATKDGSTTSGINGVDNLIEINIAFPQDGTETDLLEAQLNQVLDAFAAVAVA